MKQIKKLIDQKPVYTRILICFIILMAGLILMSGLSLFKKPPGKSNNGEKSLKVDVLKARYENIQVFIKGYGEIHSLNSVSLSPEISGEIIKVHPRLDTGEIIKKDELLFYINPVNYKAAQQEAYARVKQRESVLLRIDLEHKTDLIRIKTMHRNQTLAKSEFERVSKLYNTDKIGTLTGVDRAEHTYNEIKDVVDQLNKKIEIYPVLIMENKAFLESAKAQLKIADANLNRCTVKAPFTGRLKDVFVEKGQYVIPGKNIITMADDSVLEIYVSIDSIDAKNWLIFDNKKTEKENLNWFFPLKKVKCYINWTDNQKQDVQYGFLHRVVNFNPKTRTLLVAIRINTQNNQSKSFPLVEGMFCTVKISGKFIKNVIKLPIWTVNFENSVYLAKENRLKTIPVKVVRTEDDYVYVSDGLTPGDMVITTRLVNPLENILLEITEAGHH